MLRRAIPILAATFLLGGCGGSGSSPEEEFLANARRMCVSANAREAAATKAEDALPADAGVEATLAAFHQNWAASDRTLADLATLEPPESTGVTVDAWRRGIAKLRRDARVYETFYERQYPGLIRSFLGNNPTPKLPQGTGPSASTLAQAFNSPTGRRFLQRQSALNRVLSTDAKTFEQLTKKIERALGARSLANCSDEQQREKP